MPTGSLAERLGHKKKGGVQPPAQMGFYQSLAAAASINAMRQIYNAASAAKQENCDNLVQHKLGIEDTREAFNTVPFNQLKAIFQEEHQLHGGKKAHKLKGGLTFETAVGLYNLVKGYVNEKGELNFDTNEEFDAFGHSVANYISLHGDEDDKKEWNHFFDKYFHPMWKKGDLEALLDKLQVYIGLRLKKAQMLDEEEEPPSSPKIPKKPFPPTKPSGKGKKSLKGGATVAGVTIPDLSSDTPEGRSNQASFYNQARDAGLSLVGKIPGIGGVASSLLNAAMPKIVVPTAGDYRRAAQLKMKFGLEELRKMTEAFAGIMAKGKYGLMTVQTQDELVKLMSGMYFVILQTTKNINDDLKPILISNWKELRNYLAKNPAVLTQEQLKEIGKILYTIYMMANLHMLKGTPDYDQFKPMLDIANEAARRRANGEDDVIDPLDYISDGAIQSNPDIPANAYGNASDDWKKLNSSFDSKEDAMKREANKQGLLTIDTAIQGPRNIAELIEAVADDAIKQGKEKAIEKGKQLAKGKLTETISNTASAISGGISRMPSESTLKHRKVIAAQRKAEGSRFVGKHIGIGFFGPNPHPQNPKGMADMPHMPHMEGGNWFIDAGRWIDKTIGDVNKKIGNLI